ncbi:MAG TPA: restriction endonuclease subunit R [Usitatibacter sp.]|jgi:hypothetical protein|nr:restriction endonuclease subunit R [Usitatibacter sp.]
MATNIPKKVVERLVGQVKRYQPILADAHARDINEADTVTIVKDMFADLFGYNKYSELTSEHCIRGTYCDLATKVDGALGTLIEVKAIGTELRDNHVKQIIDYAANQGVEWVLLTNARNWRVYHVVFSKPIEHELVVDLDFLAVNPKCDADLERLFLWCKEGWTRSVLGDYEAQRQALSRFFLGAVIVSDAVIDVIRRELRRLSPDVRIEADQIRTAITDEVIKREVMEGQNADDARRKIARAAKKSLRASSEKPADANAQPEVQPDDSAIASAL